MLAHVERVVAVPTWSPVDSVGYFPLPPVQTSL